MKRATHLWYDPHLGHGAMLTFCPETRQFSNESEMTEALVEAYRAVVGPEDTCIVGGDFAHRMDEKRLRKLFDALPGTKILIRGNHDGKETQALPWAAQYDIMYASVESTRLVLCHYALRSWPGIRKGALQLYGHHHGRLPGNQQSCDVGVDVFGLAPVRLATVKAHLATLPPLVDPEGSNFGADLDGGPQP